jgi:hypothetical protein
MRRQRQRKWIYIRMDFDGWIAGEGSGMKWKRESVSEDDPIISI